MMMMMMILYSYDSSKGVVGVFVSFVCDEETKKLHNIFFCCFFCVLEEGEKKEGKKFKNFTHSLCRLVSSLFGTTYV